MSNIQQVIRMEHIKVNKSAGFTLIEIMVVVVIIGLMAALLLVNLSRDLDRLARFEAERFLVVVNEIRDEAIISGESFFLLIDDGQSSYYFEAVREGRVNTNDDGLLDPRQLQQGLELDWEVFEDVDDETTQDRVLISPLGEITPFDAHFIGEESQYHVFVNDENQLEQRVEKAK